VWLLLVSMGGQFPTCGVQWTITLLFSAAVGLLCRRQVKRVPDPPLTLSSPKGASQHGWKLKNLLRVSLWLVVWLVFVRRFSP
jgi:hypothetical protein